MAATRSSLACLAALLGAAMAAVPSDKITHLPGYPGPPKTAQYSGVPSICPLCPRPRIRDRLSVGLGRTLPPLALTAAPAVHATGYLEVDDPQGKMYYHYWFATSQSE